MFTKVALETRVSYPQILWITLWMNQSRDGPYTFKNPSFLR
jgi:hypothetical protein